MPAPPARHRSASVPCGVSSSEISPLRYRPSKCCMRGREVSTRSSRKRRRQGEGRAHLVGAEVRRDHLRDLARVQERTCIESGRQRVCCWTWTKTTTGRERERTEAELADAGVVRDAGEVLDLGPLGERADERVCGASRVSRRARARKLQESGKAHLRCRTIRILRRGR